MLVLLSGEVFGVANVGANYMFFDGFSLAVGTPLLSKFLVQEVYDEHIDEGHYGDAATADEDDSSVSAYGVLPSVACSRFDDADNDVAKYLAFVLCERRGTCSADSNYLTMFLDNLRHRLLTHGNHSTGWPIRWQQCALKVKNRLLYF